MTPTFTHLLKSPTLMLALGFGSGLVKKGPGTAGSVVGLLVYCAMAQLPPGVYVGLVAVGFAGGIWVCGRAAARLQIKDPGCIVWDEIIGMLIACCFVPLEPIWLLLAFVLFRLFDILKPWPIGWLDRNLEGGLGIMLDDVAAGLVACGLVHLAMYGAASASLVSG